MTDEHQLLGWQNYQPITDHRTADEAKQLIWHQPKSICVQWVMIRAVTASSRFFLSRQNSPPSGTLVWKARTSDTESLLTERLREPRKSVQFFAMKLEKTEKTFHLSIFVSPSRWAFRLLHRCACEIPVHRRYARVRSKSMQDSSLSMKMSFTFNDELFHQCENGSDP